MTKTLKPVTLDTLKKSRSVVAEGPSGMVFRIRPINMERYALSGSLPAPLRGIASEGQQGIDSIFNTDSDELFKEKGAEVRDYLDDLVRQVIVEPNLEGFDLDELHPADYRWAVQIAMNETDKDGRGRLLWGSEPLSRFETFRTFHECPENCDKCEAVIEAFSAQFGA